MAKFKTGDSVKILQAANPKDIGKCGVVTEVAHWHDDEWFKNGHEQLYSVQMEREERPEPDSLLSIPEPHVKRDFVEIENEPKKDRDFRFKYYSDHEEQCRVGALRRIDYLQSMRGKTYWHTRTVGCVNESWLELQPEAKP